MNFEKPILNLSRGPDINKQGQYQPLHATNQPTKNQPTNQPANQEPTNLEPTNQPTNKLTN